MGQYRLWLHYREVDYQLRRQLELLEEKLVALQEQAGRLQATASVDNVIVQALQAFLAKREEEAQAASSNGLLAEPALSNGAQEHAHPAAMAEQPTGTISRALFAWSNLPNFDTQELPVPALNIGHVASTPPSLLSETSLLSEQLMASPGGRDPQPRPPVWLENLAPAPGGAGLVDQQSTRTNLLIQRWAERWRRRSTDQQEPQEVEEDQAQ